MFTRFIRLYSLQAIEQSDPNYVLQVQIIEYVIQQLPRTLDSSWEANPHQGVTEAREIIVPQIERLLNENAIPKNFGHRWLRPFPAKEMNRRLNQAEHFLQLTKIALEVVNTGLVVWQNWQQFRHRQALLQGAVQAVLQSQEEALQNSLQPGFVTHYLAAGIEEETE